MAPGILSDHTESINNGVNKLNLEHGKNNLREPLKLSGALDKLQWEEATPVIGREFPTIDLVNDVLNAPNADELIRDLAITISQRGVVFFRAQNNLTDDLQKQLVHRLGELTGKPAASSLHVHPVLNNTSEFGVGDAEISHISSIARKKMFSHERSKREGGNSRRYDSARWHSDIQFEPCPADYTSLRLTDLPQSGGDTLWASGYEIYDRFSPAYQKFFESLSATFVGSGFIEAAKNNPEKVFIYTDARGNPLNIGGELSTVHPVVRTNPVTGWKSIYAIGPFGWKSIYAIGPFPKYINELNAEESDELLKKFYDMILQNHDLTVRFKWRNKNDLAIWDNRSAFHSATFDYEGLGERFGRRAVGIGEAPYLDPASSSRSVELGLTALP